MRIQPRIIGLVLFGVVLALIVFWEKRFNAEPSYKGKSVSYWMMQTHSQVLEDNEGLAAIGTNAIPYLARALKTKPSLFGRLLDELSPNVPLWVSRWFPKARTKYAAYQIREQAVSSLGAFGPEAVPALAALHEVLRDEFPSVAIHVLNALYNRIDATKDSIPYLISLWNTTNTVARNATSLMVIANLSKVARLDLQAVVPIFIQALDDRSQAGRHNIPIILGRLGCPLPSLVPKLILLLDDKDCRAGAAYALGQVTNRVESIIPRLRLLVDDSDPMMRASAAVTLWKYTGESSLSLPVLSDVIDHSREHRQFVVNCLGEMGPAAKEAIPLLTRIAQSEEKYGMVSHHRVFAAEAILRIDPSISQAKDILVDSLSDKDHWVRRQAAISLGELGPVVRSASAALETATHDTDRDVRLQAAVALQKVRVSINNVAAQH